MNQKELTPQEKYLNKVTEFVALVYQQYNNRYSVFEPLSKILPKYWNDIFLTAVKNVMFEKVPVAFKDCPKPYIWIINRELSSCSYKNIANRIIEQEKLLKQLIWKRNGWGDPYRKPAPTVVTGFQYKDVQPDGYYYLISFMEFKRKYANVLSQYTKGDTEISDKLIEAIYKTICDAFDSGHSIGVHDAKRSKTDADKLIDIYNNIEFAIVDLKKLLDK